MDANLDKIAKDLYGKIQTRFRDIRMGDENANVLSKKEDIPKARFFEFEYEEDGEPLGTIAITLDAQDGIVLQVSGDLVNDDDHTSHHGAYKFIRGFRQFAKDRLLNFDVQNIGKSNLDKRDYEFQAKRKEEPVMPSIMENKLYGNARMSYQDLGEARLVIKHSQAVNTNLPAGRTMHIESIYIENAQGERFKYPSKHINGARALAEHIKHGGNPYDSVGKYITGLSEELSSLRKFKGYVSRQDQLSEAMSAVTSRVMERIEEIKKQVQNLQRSAYYESFVESFEAQEEQMIPEAVVDDLVNRLTIKTFNEELKSVFPYIYKFVDESELPVVELTAEDILGEEDVEEAYNPNSVSAEHRRMLDKHKHDTLKAAAEKDGASELDKKRYQNYLDRKEAMRAEFNARMERESFDPADQFESFINDIVREDKDEIFSPNKDARRAAIEKLNTLMAQELVGGPEGTNAIMSLKGLIDDPEFVNALRDVDPDLDVRPLVQQHVQSVDPDVAAQLNFGGEAGGQQEPETQAAMAPAQAPAQAPEPAVEPVAEPVAEGKDEDPPFDPDTKPSKKTTPGKHGQGYSQARHLARQGLAKAVEKAKKAGATLETVLTVGESQMTIAEIIEGCGMSPADFGYDEPSIAGQGLPGMLKYISGFYNKEKGNFPLGGMRVKIKVKKAFEDGEFGSANPEDLIKVLKFIDMKDPSGNEHNQINRVEARPSTQETFDIQTLETQVQGIAPSFAESTGYSEDQALASIIHLAGLK